MDKNVMKSENCLDELKRIATACRRLREILLGPGPVPEWPAKMLMTLADELVKLRQDCRLLPAPDATAHARAHAQAECAGRIPPSSAPGMPGGHAGPFPAYDLGGRIDQPGPRPGDGSVGQRPYTVLTPETDRERLLDEMAHHRKALTALEEVYADKYVSPAMDAVATR